MRLASLRFLKEAPEAVLVCLLADGTNPVMVGV
jgi:hypothetical protein